jgi:hypothetical protein
VTPRRLEGWTLEGLSCDEHLPLETQAVFYRELANVAGPGRGRTADSAARRMAARGFVCTRLRGALLRGMELSEVSEPTAPWDLSTEEAADAASPQIEKVAQSMTAMISEVPQPLRRLIEQVRRNVYASASRQGSSGEELFHSLIVDFLNLFLGGELWDPTPFAAMFGREPSELDPDALDFVNQHRMTIADLNDAYRSFPLTQIAAMAKWLRSKAELAATLLGVQDLTPILLDELSAVMAPCALVILRIASGAGTDEPLISVGLPAELFAAPSHVLNA